YQCHFHPITTASKLTALLSASSDAIHVTLPGMPGSIYDALGDCFDHPIGGTPITLSETPTAKYVEPLVHYKSASGQAKWRSAQAALKQGFDKVGGDPFCSGDFEDYESLDFTCSVTASTGTVKACAWVLGGSYSTIGSSGSLNDVSKSFNCPVH